MFCTSHKKGFSLAEAITFLLVSCFIMIATMPLITRKHMKIPERQPHGKWACKLINGEMYSASSANLNTPLESWKKGCVFPVLPASVSYIRVSVIGGGAAGQKGTYEISDYNIKQELFTGNKDIEEYVVDSTGDYEILLTGAKGTKGTLSPATYDVILRGHKFSTCLYNEAEADNNVVSVKFKKRLNRGDKIVRKKNYSDIDLKYNNGPIPRLCENEATEKIEWLDEHGNRQNDRYYFGTFNIKNGKNGPTNEYSIIKNDKTIEKLVNIKGSGGGYYASASDSCTIDCSKRYIPMKDRMNYDLNKYLVSNNLTGMPNYRAEFVNANLKSSITSSGKQVLAHGGCGGAAGQVQTIIIEKPDSNNIQIQIGRGGVASNIHVPDESNTQINGEDTRFGFVIASGGQGCAGDIVADYDASDGENADTPSERDSKGGAGGKGARYLPIPNLDELNGADSQGFGSGGGGGGIAVNIPKSTLELYLSKGFYNFIKEKIIYGKAGNGSSGGIIVSW